MTASISEAATITIAGQTLAGPVTNFSRTVSLDEGANTILVGATDAAGNVGSAQVTVLRDTSPPQLSVLVPSRNAEIVESQITVVGSVYDNQTGDTDATDLQVFVNGIQAEISRNSFVARQVPIAPGIASLTVVAVDRAGNRGADVVPVQNLVAQNILRAVSGGDQRATVGTALAQPLVVEVIDTASAPVTGQTVTFRVTKGSGTFAGGARQFAVQTGATGRASTGFTLGTTAGAGNNVVTAELGDGQKVAFAAEGTADASSQTLAVVQGESTSAAVGTLLDTPLVAQVTDSFGNPLAAVNVEFQVAQGDVTVNAGPSATVATDAEGRASVRVEVGSNAAPGVAVVTAAVSGTNTVLYFAINVQIPSATGDTEISGVVLSNDRQPIANAAVTVRGGAATAMTDQAGAFQIVTGGLIGQVFVNVDGFGAGYSSLTLETSAVKGLVNQLAGPVLLSQLDGLGAATTSTVVQVEVTRRDLPGFYLRIPAASATFSDGSKVGQIQVTLVNQDAVPAIPPNGATPSSIIAINPAGVTFDPPASLRMPNSDSQTAGTVVSLFALGDTATDFVGIASGQVSDDAQFVLSETGQGVLTSGIHLWGVPPTEPAQCIAGSVSTCQRLSCNCDAGFVSCTFGSLGTVGVVPSPDDECYTENTNFLVCDQQNPITSCSNFLIPLPDSLLGGACTRRTWSQCPPTEESGVCVAGVGNTAVCCPTTNYCDGNGSPQNCTGTHPVCCNSACDNQGCCPSS